MRLSASQRESLEQATALYSTTVSVASEYLTGRGLAEAAVPFRLGVVVDPLPGHEQMLGRLAIPYLTPAGPIDIRFRCIEEHDCKALGCPKYLGLPAKGTHLYNVKAFSKQTDVIGITEGELDAIVSSLAGLPAVGVPGANGWKKHYPRCFHDYSRVVVFCDGDKAGADFGRGLARELEQAIVIHLPEGEDVNSLVHKHGGERLLQLAGVQ